MSPPKVTPDIKQRGIASFFGGGGGGAGGAGAAGAAKKAPAAAATTTATMATTTTKASAEADAAATVVDATAQPDAASAGKKAGGETDVIMVDSLDSDVKREVRKKEKERRGRVERRDSIRRCARFVGPHSPFFETKKKKTKQASPAPKKDRASDEDDDDEPATKPTKRLRKVAEKEKEKERATASAEPKAEEKKEEEEATAAAAAAKPSPAAARKSPPSTAAKGKGKATAVAKNDDEEEKVEGVGAGALAAAAAHAAADVPAAAATWPAGSPVPFEFLADVFESVADETKRLVIANRLATAFRAVLATTPADLLPAVYLCVNRVAPAHAGVELGVGDATLIRALAEATGRSEAKVKLDLDRRGDLGVVAAEARAAQKVMFKPKPLTVASVYSAFRDIAASSGSGSSERKRGLIKKLLSAAGRREAGYVVRGLQGKLRIGLAEQTVLAALAVAAELHHCPPPAALSSSSASSTASKPQKLAEEALLANRLERAAQAVKRAYCECPSYDVIVPALVARAPGFLHEAARFVAGVPVKPMLAKPATGVSEVLDRAAGGELLAEYKYDGERAQVHVFYEEVVPQAAGKRGGGGGVGASPSKAAAAATTPSSSAAPSLTTAPNNLRRRVAIYSRNSEDNSGKYPDVAEAVLKALAPGVRELVLDAEVVAVDRASGKILPFQVLSTRKRGAITTAEVTVPVCLFAFDCLYKDGETLLRRPLSERREALAASLVEKPGEVQLAVGSRESGVEQLANFLDEAVAGGTEGLIVKTLDSTYEPSRRSTNWLKLKKVKKRRRFFFPFLFFLFFFSRRKNENEKKTKKKPTLFFSFKQNKKTLRTTSTASATPSTSSSSAPGTAAASARASSAPSCSPSTTRAPRPTSRSPKSARASARSSSRASPGSFKRTSSRSRGPTTASGRR